MSTAETGRLDLADLEAQDLGARRPPSISRRPSYLGVIEAEGAEIARIARAHGAETIVGVDPDHRSAS